MSLRATVVAAPEFAGGPLCTFNRLVWAAAQHGADRVELALDPRRAATAPLRLLNARGDPVALPAPHEGVLRDEHERRLWIAALGDILPPTAAGPRVIEQFLPHSGEAAAPAALRLWQALIPGLHARLLADGEAPADAAQGAPELTWIGAHQRKALRELGLAPQDLAGAEDAVARRYRPELPAEAAALVEELREALASPLARARGLAREVDPSLLGAVARMERSVRRGVDDFARAAEHSLNNHAGIRRARWRSLAQALRPAGGSQAEGLGLLAAVVLFGLEPARWAEYAEKLRRRTRQVTGVAPDPLFLDC